MLFILQLDFWKEQTLFKCSLYL